MTCSRGPKPTAEEAVKLAADLDNDLDQYMVCLLLLMNLGPVFSFLRPLAFLWALCSLWYMELVESMQG